MHARAEPQKLSLEQFFEEYEPLDQKYELVDGVPKLMAGGTIGHAIISGNILSAVRRQLEGQRQALGSDARLQTADLTIRFPDVGIYCDPEELDGVDSETRFLTKPKVLFGPFTIDHQIRPEDKLPEYKRIGSLDTIVFVDPRRRTIETYERVDTLRWLNVTHLPGADLVIRDPAVTLTA